VPRSSLARSVQRLHRSFASDSVRASRAGFIAGAAALTAAPLRAFARAPQRVVIVGAGVAGLLCAYRLHAAGVASRVFEASERIGGRTWTLRGFFADGQIVEHGGEFISLGQKATRELATELGLQLVNLNKDEPGQDVYFIDGSLYTVAEAKADYAHVYGPLHAATRAAGYPTTYQTFTENGYALDHMSVTDWVRAHVPGGTDSKIGRLLIVTCEQEYGGDASVQSALNLMYLMGFENRHAFDLDGTNEALHIVGGNDQLAASMAAALPEGTVTTRSPLVALRESADGSYRCTFDRGGSAFEISADRVCLAIPFTTLRAVDTSGVRFSRLKRIAIDDLPMGTNAKLHLQFRRRLWNDQGYDGSTYTQFPYQCSWDVSAGQAGKAGILVGFPGGHRGVLPAPAHGPAPGAIARSYLADFDRVYPGIAAEWTGTAYLDVWAHDPWHLGSYSYYGVGNYTTFAGIEGVSEGNVFFAGEQTSYDYQGYINGAVVSGERVAREILRSA
jgi:monoamine oxidase